MRALVLRQHGGLGNLELVADYPKPTHGPGQCVIRVRASAFKRHILTSKTTKSKRKMRGTRTVSDQDAPKLERMLPYK